MIGQRNTDRPRQRQVEVRRPNGLAKVGNVVKHGIDLRSKKILITGGSGFLGQHVVAEFRHAGYASLVLPRQAQFDLTRMDDIRRLLGEHRPEVVVHLAAHVGGIGLNRRRPGTLLYRNLLMGTQLIEGCRLAGVEKFVAIGTICSYPKFTPVPFNEADLWNGFPEETNAPYGLAKKMLLVQLQAYHQEFGFPGVNLLLVNLYGPGDNFDLETSHVVPALIRKFVEALRQGQRAVTLWGTGKPTREFLYVADAARAIRLATERLNVPDAVNVGSGQEVAIAALAEMIAHKTGFKGTIHYDPGKPDGQPRRCLDVTRARDLLGFRSTVALSEGLDRTIAWYLAQREEPAAIAA